MIFVPLGTQAMDFSRCLKMLDDMIDYYQITEQVIVQMGNSTYKSNHFEVFNFVPEAKFNEYISTASVIISHAGSGALFGAIKRGKKIIAVARLKKYHEMVNDHQTELTRKLSEEGYIIDGTFSLIEAWNKLQYFTPRPNDFECTIVDEIQMKLNEWMK